MSARTRKLRYPSSGPFLGEVPGQKVPEVGDGTTGIIFRFSGNNVSQVFPNAGPTTQDLLWTSYDGSTFGVAAPTFGQPIVGSRWVDFEMLLLMAQLGTTTVSGLSLFMTSNEGGEQLMREWNAYTAGGGELSQQLITESAIWLPAETFTSFRVNVDIVADAGDVILSSANMYCKFATYLAPDAV